MTAARAWTRAGLTCALVLVVDQVTKALVRGGLDVGDEDPVLPALKLVHVRNRGVAFSAFEDQTAVVVVAIVLALSALAFYFARNPTRRLVWLPTGMLTGGALGNIIDRVRDGAVTDFLKLPGWPAFNVADMAITGGVLALVLVVELAERSAKEEGTADAPDRTG